MQFGLGIGQHMAHRHPTKAVERLINVDGHENRSAAIAPCRERPWGMQCIASRKRYIKGPLSIRMPSMDLLARFLEHLHAWQASADSARVQLLYWAPRALAGYVALACVLRLTVLRLEFGFLGLLLKTAAFAGVAYYLYSWWQKTLA